jgi:nitroreductase
MDAFRALATRRTASGFDSSPIERSVIERLIEAATWAPNHKHTEPWRFHVLTGDARSDLAGRIAAWMRTSEGATESQVESTCKKLVRSPVVVVLAQAGTPDDPMRDLEDYAACSAAAQNLLLAATVEGLVSKWSTGKLATMPPAFEYFGLEPHDRIVGYIYLAHPPDGTEEQRAKRGTTVIDWYGFEG